jgi:MFS superfamily sulfate permease-like transporter
MEIVIGILVAVLTACVIVAMVRSARRRSVPARADSQGEQLSSDPR